jgi:hypothetical protein
MQPNNNDPIDWKQPTEQPAQAPYVSVPETPAIEGPVVTLRPEETTPVAAPFQAATFEEAPMGDSSQAEPVRWQAQEYIQHDKGGLWFIAFAATFVVLMAVAIFLIKSITFDILVPVMAIALLVYINRPPRLIDYTLSRKGLHINDRLYPFAEFKGFGVVHDGKEFSVLLLPVKRFKPGVSVYFPEESGEAIVDMLGARLPMQELHLDIVDRIIRKLRI